jgi:hypothetical protein
MKRIILSLLLLSLITSWVGLISAGSHALWTTPTLRPISYVPVPNTNDPSQAPFSTPQVPQVPFPFGGPPPTGGSTAIRAGAGVGRIYGDYFVDPMLWVYNSNHPATVTYLGTIYNPTWLWYDAAVSNWVASPPAGAWIPRDPTSLTSFVNGTAFTNWISTRSMRIWLRSGFTPY